MSILQRALKKAETDRAALRRADADANTPEPASARVAAASPRGRWMVVVLAMLSAIGIGYGLRGMQPVVAPASTISQPSVEAPALRPTRGFTDGEPVSLRLDRRVDTLGARAR